MKTVVFPPFDEVDVSLSGRRVAVTGATGFVGSHLVPMLLAAGAEVVAIDEGRGRRPVLPALAEQGAVELIEAGPWPYYVDQGLRRALSRCDALVHLAFAPTRDRAVPAACRLELEWNVLGTLALLDELGPGTRHVCLASSSMVYRSTAQGAQREDRADPDTAYGTGKLALERFCTLVGRSNGFTVTALRYSTVYGRMETAPRAVPNFIRQVVQREPLVIRGADDVRDYVHVNDVARATIAALVAARPGPFNVGTGIATRTDELADLIADLGTGTVPVHRVAGTGTPTRYVTDPRRARSDLGFEAAVPLRAGLRDAMRWFEETRRDATGATAMDQEARS